MTNYSTNFINYYYFVNNDVIYKISTAQDQDKCGVQMALKDENGEINLAANSNVFPCVSITYKYTDSDKSEKTDVKYYWFQSLIRVGDTCKYTKDDKGNVTEVTFTPNKNHDINYHGEEDTDKNPDNYLDIIKEQITDEIKRLANMGYTVTQIQNKLPYYAIATTEKTTINNKTVEVVSVSNNEMTAAFSEDKIWSLCLEAINEDVNVYVNNKLNDFTKTEDGKNYFRKLKNTVSIKESDVEWKEDK